MCTKQFSSLRSTSSKIDSPQNFQLPAHLRLLSAILHTSTDSIFILCEIRPTGSIASDFHRLSYLIPSLL
jgi:hypothetical protein